MSSKNTNQSNKASIGVDVKIVFRNDFFQQAGPTSDGTELTERNKGVYVVFVDVAKGNYPSSQDGRYVCTIQCYYYYYYYTQDTTISFYVT